MSVAQLITHARPDSYESDVIPMPCCGKRSLRRWHNDKELGLLLTEGKCSACERADIRIELEDKIRFRAVENAERRFALPGLIGPDVLDARKVRAQVVPAVDAQIAAEGGARVAQLREALVQVVRERDCTSDWTEQTTRAELFAAVEAIAAPLELEPELSLLERRLPQLVEKIPSTHVRRRPPTGWLPATRSEREVYAAA